MRKLFLKKICIGMICFIFVFIVLILNVKAKAMYVFDKETFYSGITSVEEELANNNTSALNENDNIVKIVENSNASSLILNVYELKNRYKAYRDNLNTTYANDSNAYYDVLIYSAMALFSKLDCKLSLELLIKAYCSNNNYEYYNPYYKDVLSNVELTKSLVHDNATNGDGCYLWSTKTCDRDAYLSLRNFHYTKASSTYTTLHITDVYDFDSNDNNIILACFGKMNDVGYLKILNLSFELTHVFSKKYSQYNNEYHIVTCGCGREYKEKHNLKRITTRYNTSVIIPQYDANNYKCSKCNYIKVEGTL